MAIKLIPYYTVAFFALFSAFMCGGLLSSAFAAAEQRAIAGVFLATSIGGLSEFNVKQMGM